eukprot:SAG31_NODE_7442_length_1688_cov_1.455003_2_plen_266_part_00
MKEVGNKHLGQGQPEFLRKSIASYDEGLSTLGEFAQAGGTEDVRLLRWELRLNVALACVQLLEWPRAVEETCMLLCSPPDGALLGGAASSKWRGLLTKAYYRRGLAHSGMGSDKCASAKRLLKEGSPAAHSAFAMADEAAKMAALAVADLNEAAKAVTAQRNITAGVRLSKTERVRQAQIQESLRAAHELLALTRAEQRSAQRQIDLLSRPTKKYSNDYSRFDALAADMADDVDSDDEREGMGLLSRFCANCLRNTGLLSRDVTH